MVHLSNLVVHGNLSVLLDVSAGPRADVSARRLVSTSVPAAGHPVSGPWRLCHLKSGVASEVVLPGPAARPLAWHHGAPFEDLATPYTPRLLPLERTCEAFHPNRAGSAEGLSAFQPRWRLG